MRQERYTCHAMALVIGICVSSNLNAQEPTDQPTKAGPPAWVIEAWESGEVPMPPANGPPSWVVDAWRNGDGPQRPAGPPAWIPARQEMAKELGLPGPPAEVIEAWKNGDGFDLPGPPDFVLDLFDS